MNICRFCGVELPKSASLCGNCGHCIFEQNKLNIMADRLNKTKPKSYVFPGVTVGELVLISFAVLAVLGLVVAGFIAIVKSGVFFFA